MRILSPWFSIIVCLSPVVAQARELQYFEEKINYWGEKSSSVKSDPTPLVNAEEKGKFPWKDVPRSEEQGILQRRRLHAARAVHGNCARSLGREHQELV